jgi:hypothetical protein
VIDLPPVKPDVVEYRLHGLRCACCNTVTRAELPLGVSALGYGARLAAMVALLSGAYRLSYRQVCAVMDDLFGVRLSRGGVGRLSAEISAAVSPAVEAAKAYVQGQSFVQTPGVEPTNNAAERALRPAVIWRRTSFGSQSNEGSQFVSRMLTVVTSLKAQHRNVLDFLTQTYAATRLNQPTPSLIPQAKSEQDSPLTDHHEPLSLA